MTLQNQYEFDRREIGVDLLHSIHETSRMLLEHFDKFMSEANISRAQWRALILVSKHPGSTQVEIAQKLEIGRAAAGKLFERLEQHKYIKRVSDAKDKRVNRLYLNEGADLVFEAIRKGADIQFDECLSCYSDHDLAQFYKFASRLKEKSRLTLGANERANTYPTVIIS